MLRLTAKATQFGHRTFTSWLIESAGTVPIMRKKDYAEGNVDNTEAMECLMQVRFKVLSGSHRTQKTFQLRLSSLAMLSVYSLRE
jgi:hypothetical protein